MAKIPLSLESIRQEATTQSFQRGESYYHDNAVLSLFLRGQNLEAKVSGSEYDGYRVTVELEDNHITSAYCTCPYDYGGWCKHIVATLLAYLHEPNSIEKRLTLEQLLDELDAEQSRQLVQFLAEDNPELIDQVERFISRIKPVAISSPQGTSNEHQEVPQITVNTKFYSSKVREILREAVRDCEDNWDNEEDTVSLEIIELIDDTKDLFEKGEVHNALAILKAITETCASKWDDDLTDYGIEPHEVLDVLCEVWTEAIFSTDLTSQENLKLKRELETWQKQWNVDFSMLLTALEEGWNNEVLQAILQGNVTVEAIDEKPYYQDNLTLIRLKILKQKGRYEEYLNIAKATHQTKEYLTMLAWLDRTEEALQVAQTQMTTSEEALALSNTLQNQGATEAALQIAQRGLNLSGNSESQLADWIVELAQELQDPDLILAANLKVFEIKASFGQYKKLATLAGDDWESLKLELLDFLRSQHGGEVREAKIRIFLYENLVEDAIAAANPLSDYEKDLIGAVMDAAISVQPDWVISKASKMAEAIMDAGKAEYYDQAVKWLKKVKKAYSQSNRKAEWSVYHGNLINIHQRKRKLMGLFRDNGL